jgi:hypothetical protein
MVKHRSLNGRQSCAGSSFVNFLDDPKETKKNQIAKFGYSVVFRVTQITEFGDLGHPKKTKETKFGDNHPKLLGSLAKNGIS